MILWKPGVHHYIENSRQGFMESVYEEQDYFVATFYKIFRYFLLQFQFLSTITIWNIYPNIRHCLAVLLGTLCVKIRENINAIIALGYGMGN